MHNTIKLLNLLNTGFYSIGRIDKMVLKFFVSFSTTDAPDIAEGIHKYFRPPNYEVFVSDIDIRAGDSWEREIQDNLMNCDVFIIVVTRGDFRQ